jgi:RND family efflux transporter MFP subunit
VHSADATLRTAQLNLDYTSIRAPISGRVSRTNVTAGNLIDDKTDLTSIVSTSEVFAYFDGSEATYLRLRGLKPAELTVRMGLSDETGVPHAGRVDFIDNQLNPQTGAIRMRAVFDNAKGQFAPGLFARIQLTGSATRQMVVTPDRAIGTDQSKKFVIVVGPNNQSEFRDVVPGPLLPGGLRAIDSGLKAGDLVIYSGLQRVHPGMPVTPNKHQTDEQGNPVETPAPAGGAAPAASKS